MANPKRRTSGPVSGENIVISVAWMYYQDGMNQKEIADHLGISRATVVNYLQEARERRYIRITLNAPAFTTHRAALALCEKFGLAAAFVVPDEGCDQQTAFQRVVRGAADWLPTLLEPGDRLGVAWGRTVYELSELVEWQVIDNLTVLQLVGSMATPHGFTAEACSTRLAQRLGARCLNLHAPAVLSSVGMAQELRAEPIIHAQLEQLETVNKFLFSVGNCDPETYLVESGLATLADVEWHVAQGAVGVLCGRFITAQGQAISGPMSERMIGVPLERLVGLDMGILVASRSDKLAATQAAIQGGYVTHLVLGLSVAQALLAD